MPTDAYQGGRAETPAALRRWKRCAAGLNLTQTHRQLHCEAGIHVRVELKTVQRAPDTLTALGC